MERELNSNKTALANADKGFDEAGDEAKTFSNSVKNAADTSTDADGKLSKLGDTAKKIGAALGAACPAVLSRQVFIQVNMINHFTECIYRIRNFNYFFNFYWQF